MGVFVCGFSLFEFLGFLRWVFLNPCFNLGSRGVEESESRGSRGVGESGSPGVGESESVVNGVRASLVFFFFWFRLNPCLMWGVGELG